MSAAAAAFGFRPAYHPSGIDRPRAYTVASGYATAIFKGAPVLLTAAGTITNGAATGDLLGIFAGVEYTDAGTGRRIVSNFWPAGQAATNIVAWVWDDPSMIYEAQTDGTSVLNQTAIGGQLNCASPVAGSTGTGLSATNLGATTLTTSGQAQFRVTDLGRGVDNALGDTFLILQVQIAQHQYVANKVAV